MRPSCGTRVSAMSSRDMTFTRLISTGVSFGGRLSTSRSTPSIRSRIESSVS